MTDIPMTAHPVQYGPSLRHIAGVYFPGSSPVDIPRDSATSLPLAASKVAPDHLRILHDMGNRMRAITRQLAPTDARAGDVVWIRALNEAGLGGVEPLQFATEVPFVLDAPCPRLGEDAWHAWLASPFTAYATNWDVFVPWDDPVHPYDPEACVVHASRRVAIHLSFAATVTTRVSPTFLAGVRAVADEFAAAALSGKCLPSASAVDGDSFRMTLGGLRTRTGPALLSDDDPRLAYSQLTLALSTEMTGFAEAWALARAEERRPSSAGIPQAIATALAAMAGFAGATARLLAENGLPKGARAAASQDMVRFQLGADCIEVHWYERGHDIDVQPERADESPLLLAAVDAKTGENFNFIDERGNATPVLLIETSRRRARVQAAPDREPLFVLYSIER